MCWKASLVLPPDAPQAQVEQMRQQLGLNDPLWQQFVRTLGGWLQGDFGNSYVRRTPALAATLGRLPATLLLAAGTLAMVVPLALIAGIYSARRPGSFIDRAVTFLSMAAVSMADFWLGLLLIAIFAVGLGWLPTSGYGGMSYLLLPMVTLGLRPLARISQVTRANLINEMRRRYVLVGRSKGLSEAGALVHHALRNVAIPIITVISSEAVALLNGAVVIETVFGWPGIGSLLISAINARDFPVIQSTVMVIAVMVIIVNLAVDLAYLAIDPRIAR